VADLQKYIPARMKESDVPGLAVALIRDGRVAWKAGFGATNRLTNRPVTPDTLFEAASNSKVITTYAALRLVEQGDLSLDVPLSACLKKQWLSQSPHRDRITLRHVASHSSGLTDNLLPLDKSIAFEPGSTFSYSGVGFRYMQESLEQVTGTSLEEAARAVVFEPLGMTSSSFVNRTDLVPRMANGHMTYSFPLLSFMVPFTLIFVVILVSSVAIRRFRVGTWRPLKSHLAGSCLLAALLVLLLVYLTLGRALPNIALLVVLCAVVSGFALVGASYIGRRLISRMVEGPKLRGCLCVLWLATCAVAILWFAGNVAGPVPKRPSPPPSAVGSLRTSAPDLAVFLIELAAPRVLNESLVTELRKPQISINDDFSWGLGIGIQHGPDGDALWQNGMTFGFRSVMVIYPEHSWGVVVMTNSDQGLMTAYDVAARALGGKARWSVF
jgi:CubicO group peptidase (beta-lactamase class C family)